MPIFCGENPEGWIFRAELFFEINRLTEAERMMAVGVSFEEEALAWFRWVDARTPLTNWNDLKRQLLSHFGSSRDGSLCERFLGIRQVGTVADYRKEYELMSATMTGLPDEVLESTFVKGLKPEIRAEVRVLKPMGLDQIMETAQLVEEKNMAIKSIKDPVALRVNRPSSFNVPRAQDGVKTGGEQSKSMTSATREGRQ